MGLWTGLFVLFAWQMGAVGAQRAPANSVFYECNRTSIHLVVKIDPWSTGLKLNPQFLSLGSCLSSSENNRQGFFHFQYYFKECGFARLKSGKMVEHLTNLVYSPPSLRGRFYNSPFAERINCTDYEARVTPPQMALLTGQLSASSMLKFTVKLMNEDFSAPSDMKIFFLGSHINIEFAVQSFFHQTLRIFVDECTAAATPELHRSPRNYSIITNHGCLVDGMVASSSFLPRPAPEVIHLSMQAFEFVGINTDVYIHCQVLVWDPEVLTDPLKKACSFHRDTKRWELLDDPSSSVCSCCESECQTTGSRHKRDLEVQSGPHYNVVVGHLRIQKPAQHTGSDEWDSNSSLAVRNHKGGKHNVMPPAVGALLLEVAVVAVLSLGFCFYNGYQKRLCLSKREEYRNLASRPLVVADQDCGTAQVLAQENGLPNPTADSSSYPGTTAAPGFFQRVFNAARGLVSPIRHDASTTMSTAAPGFPAASPRAHVPFTQEPLLKGVGQVNFSLGILNEDLSVAEEPGAYVEGSAVHIEARVQTAPGMLFPKIFIDECYGTNTKQQIHPRRLYEIVDNHGCLYSAESETVASWFRKEDSVIVFTIPAFLLTGKPEEEIYIHCLLTAWSQKIPTSPGKKACYFNRVSSSWKNIDEPSKTSVCNCCDNSCPTEPPRPGNFKGTSTWIQFLS
uniref:zona pellucida sperm-binding protein 3-like n=1 Tax=Euleptes europaea TaxID=460621 RepID=UPI0025414CCB|nr:zona pellucida sperm-binding protein 3-like [Euleptes europaea]